MEQKFWEQKFIEQKKQSDGWNFLEKKFGLKSCYYQKMLETNLVRTKSVRTKVVRTKVLEQKLLEKSC